MSMGKARQALIDALNGDIDGVDPAARRGMLALATEHDDHSQAMDDRYQLILDMNGEHKAEVLKQSNDRDDAIDAKLDEKIAMLTDQVGVLRKLLVTTSMTFVATLVGVVVNILAS